jgi:hypothetical protein
MIDERRVDALNTEIICDEASKTSAGNVLDTIDTIVLIDDSIDFHSCLIYWSNVKFLLYVNSIDLLLYSDGKLKKGRWQDLLGSVYSIFHKLFPPLYQLEKKKRSKEKKKRILFMYV